MKNNITVNVRVVSGGAILLTYIAFMHLLQNIFPSEMSTPSIRTWTGAEGRRGPSPVPGAGN